MELELQVDDLLLAAYPDVRATYDLAVDAADPPLVVQFRPPTVADLDEAERSPAATPMPSPPSCWSGASSPRTEGATWSRVDGLGEDARDADRGGDGRARPTGRDRARPRLPLVRDLVRGRVRHGDFLLQELDARAVQLLEEVHALALHYHWSEREILALAPTRRERYLALLADSLSGAETAAHAAT